MSEREGSQRERGARRAGRLAAPRGGAGVGGVPVSLSEERTRTGTGTESGVLWAGRTGGGTASPPVRPAPLVVRAVLGVLVVLAAVALAVIECFLVPLRAGTVPLPVCVPLAVAGNVVLARLAGGLTGRPLVGVLPPVLWLAVVLVLAAPRAEGDLIVPGTLTGLVFLFAGAVAGAYGAATTVTRGRNPTIAARG
jgi:hypothetical protein